MKITLVCGSTAKKSHTKALLLYIDDLLRKKGIDTVFWDLLGQPLPIAIPEYHKKPLENPGINIKNFVTSIMNSDGFILGSPLYHGSFSGVLKNALDNLHFDAFRNKPVALVSNSSSIRNCAHPCEHLRLVVRALYGYAIQSQIGTANSDYDEKENQFILINEEIKERCIRLTEELIGLATVLVEHHVNKED